MTKRIKAWHFFKDGKLRDGNTVAPGYVYSVEGPLRMCEWGLHQSERPIDALRYAPGSWVGYCEAWGDVEHDDDKFVSRHREYLWVADAEKTLRLSACWCVRHTPLADGRTVWDLLTDARSKEAVVVAERFAAGNASVEELDAAGTAAGTAARDAAWAAARDAARDAAWDAAWDAQNEQLTKMLEEIKP